MNMSTKEQDNQTVLNLAAARLRKRLASFKDRFALTAKEGKDKLDEADIAIQRIIEVNKRIRSNWPLGRYEVVNRSGRTGKPHLRLIGKEYK